MYRRTYFLIQMLAATVTGISLSLPVLALPASNLGNATKVQPTVASPNAPNQDASAAVRGSEDPKQAESLYNEGVTLQQQGKLEEAIAQYQQAVRLNPNLAVAHLNMGAALAALGKREQAITAYQAAIALQPNLPEAYYNLGNALAQEGKLPDAIAQYQQAIRINPHYAKAYYNLGNVLAQQGNKEGAITQWRETVRIEPDFAEAYANIGLLLSRSGQRRQAVEAFKKARDLFKAQGKPQQAEQIDRILQRLVITPTAIAYN